MVEGNGLENRRAGNCTEGSNPSLSANLSNFYLDMPDRHHEALGKDNTSLEENSRENAALTDTQVELIETHYWMVEWVSGKIWPSFWIGDPHQTESDAQWGLFQAAKSFDPHRGISFRTHAYNRMRGSILDGVRETRGRRGPAYSVLYGSAESTSATMPGDTTQTLLDTIIDPSPSVEAQVTGEHDLTMRDTIDEFGQSLLPVEREILELRVKGLLVEEIADMIGVTGTRISQRLSKAIGKLRHATQQQQQEPD